MHTSNWIQIDAFETKLCSFVVKLKLNIRVRRASAEMTRELHSKAISCCLCMCYIYGHCTAAHREGHSLARNIIESIFIRVNNPTLNRNIGKFNLPHIWDRVLLKTPGLNLKRHVQAFDHVNSNNFTTPL